MKVIWQSQAITNFGFHGIDIGLYGEDNIVFANSIENCEDGFYLDGDRNFISYNYVEFSDYPVYTTDGSSSNKIFLNIFSTRKSDISLTPTEGTNFWNASNEYEYSYKGKIYKSRLGNYWSFYSKRDSNQDGISDITIKFDKNWDYYPLMEPISYEGELHLHHEINEVLNYEMVRKETSSSESSESLGFEAILAIGSLISIAYLVLRRRR